MNDQVWNHFLESRATKAPWNSGTRPLLSERRLAPPQQGWTARVAHRGDHVACSLLSACSVQPQADRARYPPLRPARWCDFTRGETSAKVPQEWLGLLANPLGNEQPFGSGPSARAPPKWPLDSGRPRKQVLGSGPSEVALDGGLSTARLSLRSLGPQLHGNGAAAAGRGGKEAARRRSAAGTVPRPQP